MKYRVTTVAATALLAGAFGCALPASAQYVDGRERADDSGRYQDDHAQSRGGYGRSGETEIGRRYDGDQRAYGNDRDRNGYGYGEGRGGDRNVYGNDDRGGRGRYSYGSGYDRRGGGEQYGYGYADRGGYGNGYGGGYGSGYLYGQGYASDYGYGGGYGGGGYDRYTGFSAPPINGRDVEYQERELIPAWRDRGYACGCGW